MNNDKKDRTQLKSYFKSNAAPTEQNFRDFIDANLNQKEDGIAKIPDGPIAIQSAASSEELLHFYKNFNDANPLWRLMQRAGDKGGFNIANGAGVSKLFISADNGNIGVGGVTSPAGRLHILEDQGTAPTANAGSLILEHGDSGGQSSIIFKSKVNAGSDYAFLSYKDNTGTSGESGILTIGVQNDIDDHLALMPTGNVGVGTTLPQGKLHIYEAQGTKPTAYSGSILLEHGDAGGQSSIVFKSKNNPGSDFAYIAFQDDATIGGSGESNILTISTQNDSNDHIALIPSGNVGIGTKAPVSKLHIAASGNANPAGNGLYVYNETATANQDAIICAKVNSTAAGNPMLSLDINGSTGWSIGVDNADSQSLKFANNGSKVTESTKMSLLKSGNLGLGINPAGKLHLYEDQGTAPTASAGTLILEHGNSGGQSSIVFKSKVNAGSDYAYISYQDNVGAAGGETSLLTIGVQNDADDNLALMPSGNVGIKRTQPKILLDVKAGATIGTTDGNADEHNAANQGSKVRFGAVTNEFSGIDIIVKDGTNSGGNCSDILFYTWECNTSASREVARVNGRGNMGLGTSAPAGRLHIYESSGSAPGISSGSLILEHGNNGGQSSIVFRSKTNGTSDYAYISYQDDAVIGGSGEAGLLILGNQNDGDDNIALIPSGNVGIGTTSPKAPLHVVGSKQSAKTKGNGAQGNYNGWDNGWDSDRYADLSIFAESGIGTRNYFYCHESLTMSDARIKNVIGQSNKKEDLERLLRLQVTDYRYKDERSYGNKIHKKVIAQEVEQVFPEAVGQRKETIPNVYAQAQATSFNAGTKMLEIQMEETPDLTEGDIVDMIDSLGKRERYYVMSVKGNTFSVRANADPGNVFVYGKEISDFRFVDYESLFMLGISAVQELHAELKDVKEEVNAMKSELASIHEKIGMLS